MHNEQIDKSDILVDLPDNLQWGHKPFVIKSTPCGQPGYYMHLTSKYLLNATIAESYGPYAKVTLNCSIMLRNQFSIASYRASAGQHGLCQTIRGIGGWLINW